MKWLKLLLCVVAAGVTSSCHRAMTDKEFSMYQHNLFAAYATNNIQASQDALFKDLQMLSKWQSNHVEGTDFRIDYEACKALDHERLFLIYRKIHETNKMDYEFQQSLNCLALSRRAKGEAPSNPITEDEFAKGLEIRERNATIGWKTNENF